MIYLIMKTYVGYTLISDGGLSEKRTLDRRVFDVCDFKVFLASLLVNMLTLVKHSVMKTDLTI